MFTKGERPVLANSAVLCAWFKRHETSLSHTVGFVAAFCIFTMAPQVPKVASLVLYEQ